MNLLNYRKKIEKKNVYEEKVMKIRYVNFFYILVLIFVVRV